jgi:hypothetical protein
MDEDGVHLGALGLKMLNGWALRGPKTGYREGRYVSRN